MRAIQADSDTDERALRDAFAAFPSGVAAVCAVVDGAPIGMAVSSFTSVSLRPPLVSVCIARTSTTWPALRRSPRIGISVLAREHAPVATALAARTGDRFAAVPWSASSEGAAFVSAAPLHLDCSLFASHDAGDHAIVVLRIDSYAIAPEAEPLIFHRSTFRRLAG
jgi:flavin reductase (DIM6/NTAB) family NADH-FMN oxidoreductase RutF